MAEIRNRDPSWARGGAPNAETMVHSDVRQSGVTPLPDPEPSVRPGDVLLGRYRVERILGQGGMGVVVSARHIELHQLVAIKLLRGAAGEPERQRFVREARAAARLHGDHIARVHDVGTLPCGRPYMLLEHLTGRDLHQLVDQRGPLPIAEIVAYALQACDAVAEAHAHGIVHRDLKPSNLFLHEPRSGDPMIKVLDFGISKQLGDDRHLTSTRALVGTPVYMSPEQALQPRAADARSDVWALGVVLYELATGRLPFDGEAVAEVLAQILQSEPAPPSAVVPELPPWFDEVVLRCLRKPAHQRYQSVHELGDALAAGAVAASSVEPAPLTEPESEAPAAALRISAGATQRSAVAPHPRSRRAPLAAIALVLTAAAIAAVAWALAPAPRAWSGHAGASIAWTDRTIAEAPLPTPVAPAVTSPSASPSATPRLSGAHVTRPARSATASPPPTPAASTHDPLDRL